MAEGERSPAEPCAGCGLPVTWCGAPGWVLLHGSGDFERDSTCSAGGGHRPERSEQ